MKHRRKRREGWSVAGDWKLKRRRRLEAEALRSGVTGVWSVAIWCHRRLKRRNLASPASDSSRLGVTGVWIVTIGSWDDAGKLKRRDSVWIVVKVNRCEGESSATASWEYGGDGRRSVAGAKEGEASPVLKKAKRHRRLGLWVSVFKHFWRIWVFSRASEEYLFGSKWYIK